MLFTKPDPIKHSVAGVEHSFYPLSLFTIVQLRHAAKPIGRAFATLFGGGDDSVKKEIHEKQAKGQGDYERRTCVDAVSPELFKLRMQTRADAISELVDSITSEPAQRLLAMVIADSMRDAFEKPPSTPKDYEAILQGLSGEQLVDIVQGIAAANRKLFGPLEAAVGAAMANLRERMTASAAQGQSAPEAS